MSAIASRQAVPGRNRSSAPISLSSPVDGNRGMAAAVTPQSVAPPQRGHGGQGNASKQFKPKLGTNERHKNPHMTVDKSIVDELLLICSIIGSEVDSVTHKIVPIPECILWLQDLQRALRRDEDATRPISLLLGNWNIVQQKLLPLVLSCRYDKVLVITIVKILVILTKPMSEAAKKAGRLVIDVKSRKVNDA